MLPLLLEEKFDQMQINSSVNISHIVSNQSLSIKPSGLTHKTLCTVTCSWNSSVTETGPRQGRDRAATRHSHHQSKFLKFSPWYLVIMKLCLRGWKIIRNHKEIANTRNFQQPWAMLSLLSSLLLLKNYRFKLLKYNKLKNKLKQQRKF